MRRAPPPAAQSATGPSCSSRRSPRAGRSSTGPGPRPPPETPRLGRLVEVAPEGGQAPGPHRPAGPEPPVRLRQRLGLQLVPAPLGVLADADQAGLTEHA